MGKTKFSNVIKKLDSWIFFNPEACLIIIIILFAIVNTITNRLL